MLTWLSHSNKNKTKLDIAHRPKVSRFHCVELSIPLDAHGCDAAQKLHGVRFLSAEAPAIPLSQCKQRCRCRFKHHNDRRHEQRRVPFGASGIHTSYSEQKNRRLGGDRRQAGLPKFALS